MCPPNLRAKAGRFLGFVGVVVVLMTVPVGDALTCSVSQFELAEKSALPRYTFVLFHKPGTPVNEKAAATLKTLAKEWGRRANVDFEAIDASTKRGAKIAKYWQVKEFPVTFVIAPTGWCLATFKGEIPTKDATGLMTSPGKTALRDALARKKAAFLVLGADKMKGYAEAVKAAKAAAKTVKQAMKIDVATVIVNPADPHEAKLLQNLGLKKALEKARVYVTFGGGRVVLQEVEAENTEERLAFTIQLLSTADQCSLGQEIRGEPLLLGKEAGGKKQ